MPKSTLTVQEFVKKWAQIQLKEATTAQSHFNDVCRLIDHPTPLEADPGGQFFTFEAPAEKPDEKKGRADVWYKGRFIWEYKGAHADLDKAYQQLLLYRESLGNPPLLITSDTQRVILHTNFTNTVKQVHEIDFTRLLESDGLALLKRAFHEPKTFMPAQTQQQVTEATADTFVAVTGILQKWARAAGQAHDPERLAHFIIRLLFCLFAEDMGLLPEDVFTQLITYPKRRFPDHFITGLRNLFTAMRDGDLYGFYPIPYFDGTLFDDDFVPGQLPSDIVDALRRACEQDWSGIDPSIFGTLFERIIDESKRAQLGAHYTSKEDIMLIVEPVLMQPLRDQWHHTKRQVTRLVQQSQSDQAHVLLQELADQVAATRVLDPACGSGNFLYVALRQLLDLQKEIIAFAGQHGLPEIPLTVSPAQLYGIEINPYAHELAQITVWIGYLQWRFENGFPDITEPILQPLKNIQRKDAILAYDDQGQPTEPDWPYADVIIGNPPFLGGKKIRTELGDEYIDKLFQLHKGHVPHECDLVCYWFERARIEIAAGKAKRAGLLATNSIRGGANRRVLERIKQTGDIFWAQSDRDWILEGAAVNVSMVGFDNGTETNCILDDLSVAFINPDLTSLTDLTIAQRLEENKDIAYMGDTKVGPFDIDQGVAQRMLAETGNPNGRPNSDVVRPSANGLDITRRPRRMWIIDFGIDMSEEKAAEYKLPFEHIKKHVKPFRAKAKSGDRTGVPWWLHQRPRPDMRAALAPLNRYIATPAVAKHRLFVWLSNDVLPDHALLVFARDDDYFFGILHSKLHELWALRQGTSLESRPRYTPTTSFQTFPFPWPPGQEPAEDQDPHVFAIAQAAHDLVQLRQPWLHPPEEQIGITISQRVLRKHTLTNLYNALEHYRANVKGKKRSIGQWKRDVGDHVTLDLIEELDHIHTQLDHAVLDAYGWPHHLTDEQILERLLALNLERA